MTSWWLRLSRYAMPYWRELLGTVVLMLLGIFANIAKPWPLKIMIDYVFAGEELPEFLSWMTRLPAGRSSMGLVYWLAGAIVLLFVIKQAVTILQAYVRSGVASRMVYDLAGDLFGHLQRLSLQFHGRRPTGDLVQRIMANTDSVRDLLVAVALPFTTSVITIVTMYTIMLNLDVLLSVVAMIVAIPIFLLMKIFAPPMTERNYVQQELEGEMMSHAERSLSSVPLVKAFTREGVEIEEFQQLRNRTYVAYLKNLSTQLQFRLGVGVMTAAGTAIIMFMGGVHVLQDKLTIGSLLVFLAYLASLYAPLESLAYLSTGYTSAAAGARRVFEVLDEQDEVKEPAIPRSLRRNHEDTRPGHIVFEDVTFGYNQGDPVLKEVSLNVAPGEMVAVVGRTGSGKSTLISLMLRFFDPWKGRILLDGLDIRDLALRELRSQFSIVLQDPFLLPLSIAENISYGKAGASRKQIECAAHAAQAMEFIKKLPRGLDTVIGERGATLSGGQRQRISIARAILRDSPIYVLDEPTSSLDTGTESKLIASLRPILATRTVFLISHRILDAKDISSVITVGDDGQVFIRRAGEVKES